MGGHSGGGDSAPAYTPPPPPVVTSQMGGTQPAPPMVTSQMGSASGGFGAPITADAPMQQGAPSYVPTGAAAPAATSTDPHEMAKAQKNPYATQMTRPRAAVAAANQQVTGSNSYQSPNISGLKFGGS